MHSLIHAKCNGLHFQDDKDDFGKFAYLTDINLLEYLEDNKLVERHTKTKEITSLSLRLLISSDLCRYSLEFENDKVEEHKQEMGKIVNNEKIYSDKALKDKINSLGENKIFEKWLASVRIVIAFSKFTYEEKEALSQDAIKLGMQVSTSSEFDENITHMVCPAECSTPKVFNAIVCGCWVLRADWIKHSVDEGEILPEEKYGGRNKILEDIKIYVTPKYCDRYTDILERLKYLVKLGNGHLVDDQSKAHIIICVSTEILTPSLTQKVFDWDSFLAYLVKSVTPAES